MEASDRKSADQPGNSFGRFVVPVVILVLIVLAIFVVPKFWREPPAIVNGNGSRDSSKLSMEEVSRLTESKNVAIGLLENGNHNKSNPAEPRGLAEADRRFVEITEKVPIELLGWRNLAICRCLELKENKIEPQLAEQTATKLLSRDPDSASTFWIAGHVQMMLASREGSASYETRTEKAIELFKQGSRLPTEQDNPWIRYALYSAVQNSGIESFESDASEALRQAYKSHPENLVLSIAWLTQQARSEDKQIVQTVKQVEESIRPYAEAIQTITGFDVLAMLDQLRTAVDEDRWAESATLARQTLNIIKPQDIYKNDLAQMRPSPDPAALDFILYDFSAEFRKKYAAVRLDDTEPIDVSFKAFPDDRQLPQWDDVHDLVVVDFDLNGSLDIAVLRDGICEVYGRRDLDGPWESLARLEVPSGMTRIIAGATRDLEQDRFLPVPKDSTNETPPISGCHEHDADLIIFGDAGVWSVENVLDGQTEERRLVRVEQDDVFNALSKVTNAQLVDFDHDSDLDLVVISKQELTLWINAGDLRFTESPQRSSLPPEGLEFRSIFPVDWDRDVDIDLVLAGPSDGAIGYLENLRHGSFRWKPFDEEFELSSAQSLAICEIDGNVSWDIVATDSNGLQVLRTRTSRPGIVQPLPPQSISDNSFSQVATWDYDNDGYCDILAWDKDRLGCFRGQAGAKFSDTSSIVSDLAKNPSVCRSSDLDDDGDLDLVVVDSGGVKTFSNEGGNKNNYLIIMAMGDKDSKGKGHHIGSLIELKAGSHYQAQVITGQRAHFGLGSRKSADVVRIVWSSGMPQDIIMPKARQILCETMTLKGSCPFVYTWTGDKFEFFTDLCWAAPLGLQLREGEVLPDRSWEYLRIPGNRLKQKNGSYTLQITEELWEVGFFDLVELIAVDHPTNVDVYSNEKVGPAEIAEFKIHTVKKSHSLISAIDQRGRNWLDQLSHRDGVYTKPFDRFYRQGFTEDYYLELDFGELESPENVTMFLTGWIMPTDTSINISLSQNPHLDAPQLPSVWIPDGNGEWKEAISYMGFPGGKPKTIAVDLSSLFQPDDKDHRLRIASSAEIYWDEVFFTTGEKSAPFKLRPLELLSADLHYRGFSQRILRGETTPETYLYDQVTTDERWPPMLGNFTRYGNVRSLLTEVDDMMVVMSAGDEMTLRFAVPQEPLEPGWTRDFLIHNVGWDKDCDLNTVLGQTVEPMPFQAMTRYPYPPDESFPTSPLHRKYLQDYQTRSQNPADFWRQMKR